ncbi:MAG: DNA polymerase IV [Thaumarchaeota archaeon]|nr:DNA polymerase IV [Nitrososphaerota archaeon]
MARVIIHVDMDAFYSSVEQREDPKIRGLPVIVGADPKGGSGRGVVASCSYEARKYGLHSAMPISQAYKLCPDGIYLRPRFFLYERVSRDVMKVLKKYADRFEQVSIDEAFLDVSEKVKEFPDSEALAQKIKQEVYERERIICSIGVAPTKVVAKIATDMGKPNGLIVVEVGDVRRFLTPLSVSKIPGVGKKTQTILQNTRITKIEDLAKTSLQALTEKLGKHALWLHSAANGIDDSEVIGFWEPKSISSESTFEKDTDDVNELKRTIEELAEEVHRRATADNYLFKTIGLKVRFEGFETHTRAKSLTSYTDSKQIIIGNALTMLKEFEKRKKIRLLGVKVSALRKVEGAQKRLLAWMK